MRALATVSLLALAACGAAACSADTNAPPNGSVTIMCTTPTVCDGATVRACRMGMAAEVVDTCAADLACSRGRCTSSACATAEDDPNALQGCAFYTFDLDNVPSDDGLPSSLLVTNPGQVPAMATLERRDGPNETWAAAQETLRVSPRQSVRFTLPKGHLEGGGLAARGAFRLTTTLPVYAAHVQSDDSTPAGSTNSGGTLLLPAHVLGARYRALTYGQVATPKLTALKGAVGGEGQIVIVGTVDGSHVAITPSLTALPFSGGGAFTPAKDDGKVHVSLNEGDVLTIYSDRDGADLTGTLIEGDQPLAVFSGNISTTYGIASAGISSPDLAHEQLLPVSAWDSTYVAAQLEPQAGVCDPVLSPPGSSIWTILADKEGTLVQFSAPPGQTPEPTRKLGAGESFHVVRPGDFVVTAIGGAVQVMQGMDCEPSLSSAVATANFLDDYWFAVLPNFDTAISLVRPMGVPLFIDGMPLEASFVAAGSGFEVARVPLDPCPSAAGVCTHHVEGKFGLSLRGMDVLTSYALSAPTWPCTPGKGPKNCVK